MYVETRFSGLEQLAIVGRHFHTRVLTTVDELETLAPEWDALAATITPWLPFSTPTWCLTHWRYYQRRNLKIRDSLRVYVVRDAMTGELIGVAPMIAVARPSHGPLRLNQLRYLGADPNITERRGFVCRDMDEQVVAAALADAFEADDIRWDWIQWAGLRADAPAATALDRPGAAVIKRTSTNHYMDLPASFDEIRAGLSRNMKESLRKCYNSLKREGHTFRFEVLTSARDVPEALETFFRLHAVRAETDAYTIDHPNVFATPSARAFMADYATQMAARHQLCIFRLHIGDDVVATRIGFRHAGDLYLYYSGHDPAWARYSVMTTLVAEAIKWAIAQHFERVNLSFGRDRSKLRWQPTEIRFWDGFVAAPTLRGRLMTHLFARRIQDNPEWVQATELLEDRE